jgi:soluble lytic murein transglycosylase
MDPAAIPTPTTSPLSRRRLWWIVLGLLVCLGLIEWWYERQKERRYDPQILRVSQRYGIDPALVKAVVWRESRFNPRVRGRVGEIGLMQIRPLAAQEWAQTEAHTRTFEGNLFEPETNLRIGAWYLNKLLKRYARTDAPVAYALADYNAGRGNVLRWTKGPAATNGTVFLSQISYPGTQQYVRAILRRAVRYEASFPRRTGTRS